LTERFVVVFFRLGTVLLTARFFVEAFVRFLFDGFTRELV